MTTTWLGARPRPLGTIVAVPARPTDAPASDAVLRCSSVRTIPDPPTFEVAPKGASVRVNRFDSVGLALGLGVGHSTENWTRQTPDVADWNQHSRMSVTGATRFSYPLIVKAESLPVGIVVAKIQSRQTIFPATLVPDMNVLFPMNEQLWNTVVPLSTRAAG